MNKIVLKNLYFLVCLTFCYACGNSVKKSEFKTPEEQYGILLTDVIERKLFKNPKEFLDAEPKLKSKDIVTIYENAKDLDNFDLKTFVYTYFNFVNTDSLSKLPVSLNSFKVNSKSVGSLIKQQTPTMASLVTNKEFITKDSYLAVLALIKQNDLETANNVLVNIAQLIQDFGYAPYANRSYYLEKPALPYFALAVNALAKKDSTLILKVRPQLHKEFLFWANSEERIIKLDSSTALSLMVDKPSILKEEEVYAEKTISLELNCLLYYLENQLALAYKKEGKPTYQNSMETLMEKRKQAINKYLWSSELGYLDYNVKTKEGYASAAMFYPLFVKIASKEQASQVLKLSQNYLKKPGMELPAMSIYVAYLGLKNYGFNKEAEALKQKIGERTNSLADFSLKYLLFD